MSWSRLCVFCSGEILAANTFQIAAKSGPAYDNQRVGQIAEALGITRVMARKLLDAANGAPLDEPSSSA